MNSPLKEFFSTGKNIDPVKGSLVTNTDQTATLGKVEPPSSELMTQSPIPKPHDLPLPDSPISTASPAVVLMAIMEKRKLEICVGIFAGIFIWEHIGRQRKWTCRPSVGIHAAASGCSRMFTWAGKKFAEASSVLRYVSFGELGKTCEELGGSVVSLVLSTGDLVKGYTDQVKTYTGGKHKVYIGSGLFVILMVVLRLRYGMFTVDWFKSLPEVMAKALPQQ